MRDEQHGLVVALPLVKQPFLHGDARQKVERGKGLIEQQQLGAGQQRARKSRALPHAAGKFIRPLIAPAGQSDVLQCFGGAPVHLCAAQAAADFHGQAQIARHRAPREQQIALRHIAAVAAPPVNALAADQDLAAFARQQLIGQAENRGFAAAGRADHGHKLARIDMEGQPVDDIEILAVILENDIPELEHAHIASFHAMSQNIASKREQSTKMSVRCASCGSV